MYFKDETSFFVFKQCANGVDFQVCLWKIESELLRKHVFILETCNLLFLLIKTQLICIKDGGRWTGLMSSDLSHLSEGNGKVWNPKIETHFSVQTQIIRLCKTISEKS